MFGGLLALCRVPPARDYFERRAIAAHPCPSPDVVSRRYDTPMESSFPYELTCEPDLGIEIDLVDPSLFLAPPGANLAQEDAELLAMAAPGGGGAVGSAAARVKSIRSEVTWLRKTPLMGNNLYESVGYGKHADRAIERKFVVTQKGAATDGAQTLAQVGCPPCRLDQTRTVVRYLRQYKPCATLRSPGCPGKPARCAAP